MEEKPETQSDVSTPEKARPRGRERRRSRSGKMDDSVPKIFGVPVNTKAGKPKAPVALLHEVVCARLPPAKMMTYKEGPNRFVSYCIVGNHITEARGSFNDSKRTAIAAMLNKLGHHSESGYASENAPSPCNDSASADQDRNGNQETDRETADTEHETSAESEEKKSKKPRAPRSSFGHLMAIAKDMFPPVKYTVLHVQNTPNGPVFVTRCAVKHFITYGEAVGPNGKQASKAVAAEQMLRRLRTLAPPETEEENYDAINPPVVRVTNEYHVVGRQNVTAAKKATTRVLQPLLNSLYRADRFFNDHFVKAFFGGNFYDRVTSGHDYEVLLILWRPNCLMPLDRVNSAAPKLRMVQRHSFSKPLFQMGFLGDRGYVLPSKFLDWFLDICKAAMKRFRAPDGFEVSGSVVSGCFVLSIKEGDGEEFDVKLKPAFAFPSLRSLPGCTIDLNRLPGRGARTETYVVPKRVDVTTSSSAVGDQGTDERHSKKLKHASQWTFVAPGGERAALHDTHCCKPLLRLFLDLNKKYKWNLPEAALKNMFMDEALLHADFEFWSASDTASLMMMMLAKLEACLEAGTFPILWETSMIHIPPNKATLDDVSKLRRDLLGCYRRAARVVDRSEAAEARKPAAGSDTDTRAHAVNDDVRALLGWPETGGDKGDGAAGKGNRGPRRRRERRGGPRKDSVSKPEERKENGMKTNDVADGEA